MCVNLWQGSEFRGASGNAPTNYSYPQLVYGNATNAPNGVILESTSCLFYQPALTVEPTHALSDKPITDSAQNHEPNATILSIHQIK